MANSDRPEDGEPGLRLIIERRRADGTWEPAVIAALTEWYRWQLFLVFSGVDLLEYARMSPAEQRLAWDELDASPPPDIAPEIVLH